MICDYEFVTINYSSVLFTWCVQLLVHMSAHSPLVWCMLNIAHINSLDDTFCLGHWNEENEWTKTSNC